MKRVASSLVVRRLRSRSFPPTPTARKDLGRYPKSQWRFKSIRAAAASSSTVEYESEEEDDDDVDYRFQDHVDIDKLREQQQARFAKLRESLKGKKGRLWSDPWDTEEMILSKVMSLDEIPDWSPNIVSRLSQERVQVISIPTLAELASLPLPPPPPPHPASSGSKAYGLHRKRHIYNQIKVQVQALAQPRVDAIFELDSWQAKQDAIDDLYDYVEKQLKKQDAILGMQPKFGEWVEKAMQEFLIAVRKERRQRGEEATTDDETTTDNDDDDKTAVPIFMDLFDSDAGDTAETQVPAIVSEMVCWPADHDYKAVIGKMVEEWELAAHKTTKRIMLRQSTRQIARVIAPIMDGTAGAAPRILIDGPLGSGKSAALTAIVASARKSGCIVWYLPEGDQLHKNGFYIDPNPVVKDMFDLPVLSQQACQAFLQSHRTDLEQLSLTIDVETLQEHLTEKRVEFVLSNSGKKDSVTLVDLLDAAVAKETVAPMCYYLVMHALLRQTQVPFLICLDEFNCFFEPGHYFHMDYDDDVNDFIPYHHINLFQPILNAMNLHAMTEEEILDAKNDEWCKLVGTPVVMGGKSAIVCATTESHAVPRKATDQLVQNAKQQEGDLHVISIPRFSHLEVEHVLANYEATGIGKLRCDGGETVMNDKEVQYLRMVSGGHGQQLFDASQME